MFIVERLS